MVPMETVQTTEMMTSPTTVQSTTIATEPPAIGE